MEELNTDYWFPILNILETTSEWGLSYLSKTELQKFMKNKVTGKMLSLKNKAGPLLSQSGTNTSFVLSANYSAPSGQSLNFCKRWGKMHNVAMFREINWANGQRPSHGPVIMGS